MNPRKYTQGIVTHPDGHTCKAHVMDVIEDMNRKFARTSFGTFEKLSDGIWHWLGGHDFTLTFEQ